MCGRYAAARDTTAVMEVLTDLGIAVSSVSDEARAVVPSFNAAPTRIGLVAAAASRDSGDPLASPAADPAAWRLEALSWGLVPSWAKDRKVGNRMINARVETLAEKSAFRSLLATRRCLVPADGWFEWLAASARDARPAGGAKQPYFVRPGSDPLLMLAGLYTWWRDPAGSPDADTGKVPWFGSYTILTTAAAQPLAWLHDRMPVVVPRAAWQEWIAVGGGAAGSKADAAATARHVLGDVLAAPLPDLDWYPVDRRVGAVANDDPSLVQPLPGAPE